VGKLKGVYCRSAQDKVSSVYLTTVGQRPQCSQTDCQRINFTHVRLARIRFKVMKHKILRNQTFQLNTRFFVYKHQHCSAVLAPSWTFMMTAVGSAFETFLYIYIYQSTRCSKSSTLILLIKPLQSNTEIYLKI
jgi:hypothetical protein